MAFSEADMEGRRWLMERMRAAGLETAMDGAGNVVGRLPGKNPDAPAVVIGSHTDTVPRAGYLDGALGVLTGLEAARAVQDAGLQLERPLEVISFADEEGRFGGMFGSQALCGLITPATLHSVNDIDGERLEDAMRRVGLDPLAALDAARPRESIHAYLELHIEQGPVLDRKGLSAGIVEGIAGLFKWQVALTGEANHAGSTPMDMRRDAFLGLADFAHEIPRILDENGNESSRATVGKAELVPGSPNTVPGAVNFTLDVRDLQLASLKELQAAFRKALSAIGRRRELKFDFDEISFIEPVDCNPAIRKRLLEAAEQNGIPCLEMPSGAAHDAQMVSRIAPIGLVFAPSKNGVSHSPAEWTDWADVEAAATIVLSAAAQIASGDSL